MRLGGLTDFVTLLTFGVGAIALAFNQGLQLRPSMASASGFARLLKSRWSFFVPLATCIVAAVFLVVRHARQPVVQEPTATWQPAPPPPGFSASATSTAETEDVSPDPEDMGADPEGMGADPEDMGTDSEATRGGPERAGEESETTKPESQRAGRESEHARTPAATARAASAVSAGAVAPPKSGGLAGPRRPASKAGAPTSVSTEATRGR